MIGTLNGNTLDEDFHYNLTPGEVAKFKNTKLRHVMLNV